MAKKEKKFDAEKHLTKAMDEIEQALDFMAKKVKKKRQEIEKKGLQETTKESLEKAKAGTEEIIKQAREDAKKLKASVEEMLKDL